MSRSRGLPRALWVGAGLGRCEHQGAPEKAPNGVSCHSRRWPITSLAVDLGFWQVKDLGVFGWGGDFLLGVGMGGVCAGRWTGTAVGKGCQGGTEEVGRNVEKGGEDLKDLGGGTGESVQCAEMPRRSRRRPLRPTSVWNVKRREKPERFGRQGRLGTGAWAATSKGPRGIPGQLGLCALRRAPEPGVVQLLRGRATHQNPQRPPPAQRGPWGSGARAMPVKAHWLHGILSRAARAIPSD